MKTVAIYIHPAKPEALEYASMAIKILDELGAEVFGADTLCEELRQSEFPFLKQCSENDFEKKADVVLSFGGDGTMLFASKLMMDTGIPIMGFNVGKLGFLAEYPVIKLKESLQSLMDGNYRIVERSILECTFNGKSHNAINDFVMEKKNTSRMITIRAFSNNNHVADYRADGLIITTPTGSTAYSLSCGGPIITPGTPVVCLTPISPHTLTLRPLVIPDTAEISLTVESPTGESNFVIDGQDVFVVNDGDKVIIKKSDSKVKLIKPLDSSYYDLLREKFLWASHYGMRVGK
ncbi:NAD(+)/NADH kinase [Candidatus Kapabacteria bacterium]|nr:NAD(+)/NADH kinase [Candidatus Kapabacteria bacterium]